MSQHERLEQIVELLHGAALDETKWVAAASLVSETFRSSGNALVFCEGSSAVDTDVLFARFCFGGRPRDDWARRYFVDYWDLDERIPRLFRLPDSQPVPTRDLYTDSEKKGSRAYNEMLRRIEVHDGVHVRLDGPEGCHIVWAHGNSRESGGWRADQIRMIEDLLPHLRQFVRVRWALAEAAALGGSLAELLDNARLGVIYLDRRKRIASANDVALGLLREGDRIYDRGGYLAARSGAGDEELQHLLARAVPSFGRRSTGGSMFVGRSATAVSLALHVNPLGPVDQPGHFRSRGIAALVLVVDPTRRARIDPGFVQGALHLTPAESRVAVALAAGYTVSEIAEERGCTVGTIRWHIHQIFRKQGISRQTELLRRVLSLHGFIESDS